MNPDVLPDRQRIREPAPDPAATAPDTVGSRRVSLSEALARSAADLGRPLDALIVGGGCAGLALATSLTTLGGSVAVVESRSGDRDGRTWCYWDTGDALVPEAVSRSWDRWEIRTTDGGTVAEDPAHPYRMVRSHDYRAAARRRIAGSGRGRVVDGTTIVDITPPGASAGAQAPLIVDARGPAAAAAAVPPGRVALYQRFVGRWVRTTRPVFDDTTVTLMDFPDLAPGQDVQFFYVLPVAPDVALVECTVFARSPHDPVPFRDEIDAYVLRRWGLAADEWTVDGEEAGCIPMTDAPVKAAPDGTLPFGMRAGIARPSTGYAFTRIQLAAQAAAAAVAAGTRPIAPRDRLRTRMLDAIFLRFLRDQGHAAPAVFLRMFATLPGPLTVRFLTERSGPLDEIRLILALPKVPFLRAAATAAVERARAGAR